VIFYIGGKLSFQTIITCGINKVKLISEPGKIGPDETVSLKNNPDHLNNFFLPD